MGKIISTYLFPHPPIILPEIGRGEEKKASKTIEGVKELSKDIKEKSPSTIIVITPHGPIFSDAITISVGENLEGDFGGFGYPTIKLGFENNLELARKIIKKSNSQGIIMAELDKDFARDYDLSYKMDHGVLVPLYFVDKLYKDYKLIHISYGLLGPKDLYSFGRIIQQVVEESDEEAVIIASGDLSHKLSKDGPYEYSPHGLEFDKKIMSILREGNMEEILNFDLSLSEKAGECGLRSLMIMAGSLDGLKIKSQVLSYEGPYGVGYGTAKIDVLGRQPDQDLLKNMEDREKDRIKDIRKKEDAYVRLARQSLEHYIRTGREMPLPEDMPRELLETRKPVFVTLKKNGLLRGCIGTTVATRDNLALEIIRNAIQAGSQDPRFPPVEGQEAEEIVYSVDVLSEPEVISSKEELDVENYGLVIEKGFKRGLLLPNIDGVDSVEKQIAIVLEKAGISKDEDYTMKRFKVVRHE